MPKSLDNLIWSSALKSDRKLLLLALAHHANHDGVTFPGVPLLSRETGFTTRGVEKMLNAFVVAGVLLVVERGNGRGNTNKYQIVAASLSRKNPEYRSGFVNNGNPEQGAGEAQKNPEQEVVDVNENPEQEITEANSNPERTELNPEQNEINPEPYSGNDQNPELETPNGVRGMEENPEPYSGLIADEPTLNPEQDACAYIEQPIKELKKYISGANAPGANAPAGGERQKGEVEFEPEEKKPSAKKSSRKKTSSPKSEFHNHVAVVAYRDITGFKAISRVQAKLIAEATGEKAETPPEDWVRFLEELAETGNQHTYNVRVMVSAYAQYRAGKPFWEALDVAWCREKGRPIAKGRGKPTVTENNQAAIEEFMRRRNNGNVIEIKGARV